MPSSGNVNRLVAAIRRIIRSEFPNYTFMGTYEYVIQTADDMKVSADPTDTKIGLPSISNLMLSSSILGEEVKPTVGNLILVIFVNGSPSRPRCISCAATNETIDVDATQSAKFGKSATTVQIAGGVLPAARATDTILAAGIFAGTITSGSSKTTVG